MSYRLGAAAALILVLAAAVLPIASARATSLSIIGAQTSRLVTLHADESSRRLKPIMAPAWLDGSGDAPAVTPKSDIVVTYNGFTNEARDAFEAAVMVWESMVESPRVIHVNATWANLGPGVLGAAGPTQVYQLSDGYAYPAALAEAICDCEGSDPAEISATFNNDFGWYFGTDGRAPSLRYDLMTVVMHEIGHGLGFLSSYGVASGQGRWGHFSNPVRATRFDTGEYGAATGGQPLTTTSIYPNPSAALASQLTDGSVYFGGANVLSVLGNRARLYAPATWSPGSSNSHFDEDAFAPGTAHALMTPFLSRGEVIHDPGPLTLALLRDIGWTTHREPAATAPGAPTGVQAVGGDSSATVSWSPPASDGGRTVTAYTVTSSPEARRCTALATSCTVTGLTNGVSYTFRVVATNSVGDGASSGPSNAVTPEFVPDTTGPSVALPAVAMVAGQVLAESVVVEVAWPAASDPSGILRYELERRKNSRGWIRVALETDTATSARTPLAPGNSYRFRLRAIDTVGNVGPWTTTTAAKFGLKQEHGSVMAYSKGWTAAALSGSSGGNVRHSAASGRWARLSFTGTSAAFVSTLGPARGIADIWIDGSYAGVVDLYAPTGTAKAVVWSTGTLSAAQHTLTVFVTGSKNPQATLARVDVDAFLVWE